MSSEIYGRLAAQNEIRIFSILKKDKGGMGVKFLYKGKEFEIHLPSEVFRHDNQEKIDFGSFFSWALDNPLKDDIEVIMPMLELAAKMEREIIFLRQP